MGLWKTGNAKNYKCYYSSFKPSLGEKRNFSVSIFWVKICYYVWFVMIKLCAEIKVSIASYD